MAGLSVCGPLSGVIMSRKPDYKLKVLNKKTEDRAEVGAGWANEDGSISSTINICAVITRDPDEVITLFPVDNFRGSSTKSTR